MSKLTPSAYTLIPGTQVLRSKIDVFTMADPSDEDHFHRVELTVDNDGIFITAVENCARENVSISHKDEDDRYDDHKVYEMFERRFS